MADEDDFLSSDNIGEMARVFHRSCQMYVAGKLTKASDCWVLFVIDESERNICDQKLIEIQAFEKHGVRSLRLTFLEIYLRASRDLQGVLMIDGDKEVALVYYRTGYQFE